jgi:hypothetical protein
MRATICAVWLETDMKGQRIIFAGLSFGLVLALAQFVGAISKAQQAADMRVADLVKAGKLRVGLGLGSPAMAIKNPANGEVRGPALELARALAAKMGIGLQSVEYPRPGAVLRRSSDQRLGRDLSGGRPSQSN